MSKKPAELLLILFLLAVTIAPRLYRWDRPLADWHSWRQADTTSVTRRYVKEGINLLVPKYDDLSSIPSGLDNPQGYRMVEFPFINAFIAQAYILTTPFQHLPIHVFNRLVNILFSAGSTVFLYYLVRRLTSTRTGLISALVFALLPFNIFFSATTLPEVPLVFFTLASMYFWIVFCQSPSTTKSSSLTISSIFSHSSNYYLLLFTLTAAAAMLLKPTYVFIGPALLYFLIKERGFKSLKHWYLYLVAVVVIAPFLWWRHWITAFPSGIPANTWLFNGNHIRFKGAFFHWLFAKRLGEWILGYWGLIPFGLGIIAKPHSKAGWFFHIWLAGMISYLFVFATGNVTHDYYQIVLIPAMAVTVALGIDFMLTIPSMYFSRLLTYCLLPIALLFAFAFSWFNIRDYFNINNPAIVAAGKAVDQRLLPDAKVIAPYMGDTAFLYQINRSGWPLGGDIAHKIELGATAYVSTTYDDEARDLESRCQLLDKTDQYILIALTDCTDLTN